MNSQGAAVFNGSPDSSSSPPPPPHDHGGHNHQASTSDIEGGEATGTRETDSLPLPITNPLQPSPSTPSPPDLEAARPPNHQQPVRRSPIRGETVLNLCVQPVVLIIQIHFQQDSSTTNTTSSETESLPIALYISAASFAFGFTSTLIGMFFRRVNEAAASVMEVLGFLSTLFGFFLVMGMCLSQRFGGIIAWPLVAVLFLASASAYAYATYK